MTSINLEVPIFGPASAHFAVSAGASRIELNALGSYPAGGLTPAIEDLAQLDALTVPVRIMIRPRGPPPPPSMDFIYSDDEMDSMEQSIQDFKSSGLLKVERGDGFVFGVLRDLGAGQAASAASTPVVMDVDRCARLVRTAQPFKTVFHRAFDEIVDRRDLGTESDAQPPGWEATLRDLIGCGFNGILTSGGPGNAIQNINTLEHIHDKAGDEIEIIVGGGVRSSNVRELGFQLKLQEKKGGGWVHSSCLTATNSEQVDVKEVNNILAQLL